MKKTVMLSVILLLVLLAVPHAFAATTSGSCGDGVTWKYTSSTYTLTISGSGAGTMYDYGYVSENGSVFNREVPWKGNTIKKIVINSGVKYIGREAFKDQTSLTQVTMASSVTELGAYAFDGCNTLTSIPLSTGLKTIGAKAFQDCIALTSVTFPQSLETIGTLAYAYSGLTSVTIPSTLKKIESNAFYATMMTQLTISSSSTVLETGCFGSNQYLKTVSLPAGMTEIPDSMFSGCLRLNSITIPSSVTRIGNSAFYYCQGLYNLELPSGLQEIGSNAFRDAGKSLFLLPGTVTTIGLNAFDRSNSSGYTVRVLIPDSVTSLPDHMLLGNQSSAVFLVHASYPLKGSIDTGANIIEVDDSVPLSSIEDFKKINNTNLLYYTTKAGKMVISGSGDIPANFCKGKTTLKEVEIQGNSTINIGASAFEGCTNLTKFRMPKTPDSVGDRAFYNCSKLSDIRLNSSTIDNNIATYTLGSYAFYGCNALTRLQLSVYTSIGEYAFANCTGITDASCGNSTANIPQGLFQGCTGLQTIYLPQCPEIGTLAFDGCSSLTKCYSYKAYSYYSGYTTIPANTFRDCTSLDWFYLPAYVTTVSDSAFPTKTLLLKQDGSTANTGTHASMNLPAAVTEATHITGGGYCGTNATYYITGYTNNAETVRKLTIAGTGAINANAFKENKGFNRVVIGEGITEIGSNAFQNTYCCEATLPVSLQTIGAYAFDGCTNFDTVSWQSGLKTS